MLYRLNQIHLKGLSIFCPYSMHFTRSICICQKLISRRKYLQSDHQPQEQNETQEDISIYSDSWETGNQIVTPVIEIVTLKSILPP